MNKLEEFEYVCFREDPCLLSPSNLKHELSSFSGLQTHSKLHPQRSGLSASRQQSMGPLSLHNHVSQFLEYLCSSRHLSIVRSLGFSGEYWLIEMLTPWPSKRRVTASFSAWLYLTFINPMAPIQSLQLVRLEVPINQMTVFENALLLSGNLKYVNSSMGLFSC